jgi:extracellular factor (EF) 3-hydroxypalmitic acid methyl ester biosynthesis protein
MKNGTNGNGKSHLLAQNKKKPVLPISAKPTSETQTTAVSFKALGQISLSGIPLRINRHSIVFELYSPNVTPQFSESLDHFKIVSQGREIYSGRAVISNVTDAGIKTICEATLDELHWREIDPEFLTEKIEQIPEQFKMFLQEWQKLYKVGDEFKIAVADMQAFLHDLRFWFEQIELILHAQPKSLQNKSELKVLEALEKPVLISLGSLFERFEQVITKIDRSFMASHSSYAKSLLHPLVLSSPFMRRTFEKPLGYAGDYEMVNMMTRNPYEGNSLFAKFLNAFFLNTPPVVAHRNRIDLLVQRLEAETRRNAAKNCIKIFNLGCGPALEIQRYLPLSPLSKKVEFTLLDFNNETVEYTQRILNEIKNKHQCGGAIHLIKKSVMQLLKDSSQFRNNSFDLVYCAGLFDYLPDTICERLVQKFYDLTMPGGLVLVSNVHVNNPSRGWMEYVVDWNLVYRNTEQMQAILPKDIPKEFFNILVEPTGVNIFVEIRKPKNA